jgi:hypothetical protein
VLATFDTVRLERRMMLVTHSKNTADHVDTNGILLSIISASVQLRVSWLQQASVCVNALVTLFTLFARVTWLQVFV